MLGIYIDITLVLIANGYKPLIETFKIFFQTTLTFITKTKQEPNNQIILKKIQKAADVSLQCKSYIKEQITATKNAPAIAGKASYTAITLQSATTPGISYLPTGSAVFTSSYNKANKIIIKLNDKNAALSGNSI